MSQKKQWKFGYLFRWMTQLKSKMFKFHFLFLISSKNSFPILLKRRQSIKSSRQKSGKKWFLEQMKHATAVKHISLICSICANRVATWCVSSATTKECREKSKNLAHIHLASSCQSKLLLLELCDFSKSNFLCIWRISAIVLLKNTITLFSRHIIISYVFILSLCANFIYFLLSGIRENRMACRHSRSASVPIHVDTCIF